MEMSESQEGQGGGVLISEIGRLEEVQPGQGMRRPSLSSSFSDESIGTSVISSHSSTGSVASDSDVMSNGDVGGRGLGGLDAASGAPAGRHAAGAPESGTKRHITEDEQRPVEQLQQSSSSSQQLRKACDLCTKVRDTLETRCGAAERCWVIAYRGTVPRLARNGRKFGVFSDLDLYMRQ